MIRPTLILLVTLSGLSALPGAVVFVKHDANGHGNGASWLDAYTDLQQALSGRSVGDSIWVAAGTYKPTSGTDRNATFVIPAGISLLGGFSGQEYDPTQRDPQANQTELSGEIGNPQSASDNVHTLVRISGLSESAVVLDGFVIANAYGQAALEAYNCSSSSMDTAINIKDCQFTWNLSGTTTGEDQGRAVKLSSAGIVFFDHCLFIDNEARNGGAAISHAETMVSLSHCNFRYNNGGLGNGGAVLSAAPSSSKVINFYSCIFQGNSTAGKGGAIFNLQQGLTQNSLFIGNSANDLGGAIHHSTSLVQPAIFTLQHCTLAGNISTDFAVTSSPINALVATNSIFGTNTPAPLAPNAIGVTYCLFPAPYTGGNYNFSGDPLFVDPQNPEGDGYSIQHASPAHDAAKRLLDDVGLMKDLIGSDRPQGLGPDLGCYEHRDNIRTMTLWTMRNGNPLVVEATIDQESTQEANGPELPAEFLNFNVHPDHTFGLALPPPPPSSGQ